MDCKEIKRYLYAFLDDELDVKTNLEIQGHLSGCQDCQSRFEFEKKMKSLVEEHEIGEAAPIYMRTRLSAALDEEIGRSKRGWFDTFLAPRLRLVNGLALALSVVAVIAMSFTLYLNRQDNMSAFASEAVNNHLMYFFGEMPVEFVSPETREVTNWFEGRPNFVIDVPEFRGGRLDLVGGRLCSANDKRAAYIMYRHNDIGHRLSLFAFNNASLKPIAKRTLKIEDKTFHINEFKDHKVILWKEGDIVYSMVSDIGEDDLMELTQFVINR